MSAPRVKKVSVSVSPNGKLQIVQFQYSAGYHYSVSKEYEVDMTDGEADDFWQERLGELQESMGEIEQKKVDELMELRDELAGS